MAACDEKMAESYVQRERILVTGASGFVGYELLKQLTNLSHSTIALYRGAQPEALKDVIPVCSDLGQTTTLASQLNGIKTIVHLAWENPPESPRSPAHHGSGTSTEDDSASGNLTKLKNLIAAAEIARCRRILFLSADGACHSDLDCPSGYLAEKYEGERMVLASSIPERIIVRSPIVFGGELYRDRFLRRMLNLLRFPLISPAPQTVGSLRTVHVEDLAIALANLATRTLPQTVGVVEVGERNGIAMTDLFERVASRYCDGKKFLVTGRLGRLLSHALDRRNVQSTANGLVGQLFRGESFIGQAVGSNGPFESLLPSRWQTLREFLASPVGVELGRGQRPIASILSQ